MHKSQIHKPHDDEKTALQSENSHLKSLRVKTAKGREILKDLMAEIQADVAELEKEEADTGEDDDWRVLNEAKGEELDFFLKKAGVWFE